MAFELVGMDLADVTATTIGGVGMAIREDEILSRMTPAEVKAAAKAAKKRDKKDKAKAARTPEEKAAKQARARARRQVSKRDEAISQLYKPIEEWDGEELARGKPRSADGSFRGPAPKWISRAMHEEAVRRFKDEASSDMRALVPLALTTVEQILTSTELDDRGKPVVPAGVRLEAAKWTVEHLVGKPTQRTEMDISVKLQGILANVMVNVEEVEEGSAGVRKQLMPAMEVESWDLDEGPDGLGEGSGSE